MTEIPRNKEFWADVLKKIVRRTGDADAEDLMHSAFLRLEQYQAGHTISNPAAFLVRTAVNIRIDGYRQQRRFHDAPLPEQPDPCAPADEIVAAKLFFSRVTEGINRLPDRTREIFLMHRIDKLEYTEIAARLGITVSAVEKQMAKAMLFLAEWSKGW